MNLTYDYYLATASKEERTEGFDAWKEAQYGRLIDELAKQAREAKESLELLQGLIVELSDKLLPKLDYAGSFLDYKAVDVLSRVEVHADRIRRQALAGKEK